MKNLIYLLAFVSFIYSQQGLQLNDLEPGDSGKLMYPYSGKTFDLWPNGDLKVRGRLRDGLMNGKWEYYHTNGSKMAVGKYFDGDGSDIDPETKIPRKGFVGNWTFYYKSGQQWQEGRWKDGVPTGEHVKWYPNGNTKTILTYENGGLEGPITKWFEDGQVKEESFYVSGKLDSSY